MKVLFIAHGFPPAQHSGTFRSAAFAHHLPEFDVQLAVVCATDADRILPYGEAAGWRDDPRWLGVYRTAWKLYQPSDAFSSVKRLLQRVPLGATLARRSIYRAVLNRVLPLAREAVRTHRPDIIYASAPPTETLLLADRLAREFRIPFVCDLRDPWSYNSWARYRHRFDFLIERRFEHAVLSRAARVIANTPTARTLLLSKIRLSAEQVLVIPNGYDERDFQELPPVSDRRDRRFTMVYTGLLSFLRPPKHSVKQQVKRALDIDYRPVQSDPNTRSAKWVLQAVDSMLTNEPPLRDRVRIVFAGSFSEEEQAIFKSFRYPDCLSILPPVSRREALDLCRGADLLLLLQIEMKLDGRDCCTAIPGKLYDYLRTGTRILAPLQRSDTQELIERFDAGVVVPPRDVKAIEAALRGEIRQWGGGEPARRKTVPSELQKYERRALASRLADLLRDAAKHHGAGGAHAETGASKKAMIRSLRSWISGLLFPSIYLYKNPFKILEYIAVLQGASFSGNEAVLDLGCGTGKQTLCLARKSGHVLGIDPDAGAIRMASDELRRLAGRANIDFRHTSLPDARLADASFDKIFSFSVIEHIREYESVLVECRRLLKPGGQFLFSVDSLDAMTDHPLLERHKADHKIAQLFQAPALRNQLVQLGFRDVRVRPIFRSRYARKEFLKGIETQFRYGVGSALRIAGLLTVFEAIDPRRSKGLFLVASCVK